MADPWSSNEKPWLRSSKKVVGVARVGAEGNGDTPEFEVPLNVCWATSPNSAANPRTEATAERLLSEDARVKSLRRTRWWC